jgi:quinoprotein glucose dehydrogenase
VTTGYRLIALNAKTGAMIPSFGEGGVVDMKKGTVFGKGQQIDLETGEIGLHSTPTVVKDVIIVGSSFKEGMTVKTHNNTKGHVRAFDVKTGKMLWQFNTIPKAGEFGADTWENESWSTNGNTGVWTQITVDEEAGLVYLPVETPSSDFYGGHRPGNNLFSESLVCVDLKTGQRKWHYQIVHHAIWDYDLSSAPILSTSPSTASRSRPWRCRARKRSSTPSIASPVSRCGRSRRSRCRSPTCRVRRRRRRSRSRPSRRRTRGRPSRSRT